MFQGSNSAMRLIGWIGDAAEHLAQVGLLLDREQIILPAEDNLAVILPISGRTLWSNIAGIRCTDRGCVVFRASGAHRVSWCTWS